MNKKGLKCQFYHSKENNIITCIHTLNFNFIPVLFTIAENSNYLFYPNIFKHYVRYRQLKHPF